MADTSEIIPNINNSNLSDASDRVIGFGQKISDTKQKIGDYQSTFNDAKENNSSKSKQMVFQRGLNASGNNVTDFLNGKVTEDAIIQNISIGNISMPLNSNLIRGAQSLFGVRTDLKFGRTNISGVFSEQRSQSQNVVAQGGGTLQNLIFLHLITKKIAITFGSIF